MPCAARSVSWMTCPNQALAASEFLRGTLSNGYLTSAPKTLLASLLHAAIRLIKQGECQYLIRTRWPLTMPNSSLRHPQSHAFEARAVSHSQSSRSQEGPRWFIFSQVVRRAIRPLRPAEWLCGALGVSRGGFYAWLTRPRSQRSRSDEELGAKVRASFLASDRTYGARRVGHDMLAEDMSCGLHRIERLMRLQALKARPRRRRLPPDLGERQAAAVAPNVLDRSFEAVAPNRKWIADFTYVWTAEGWSTCLPSSICSRGVWSAGRCKPR
jgi:hypothetical protein